MYKGDKPIILQGIEARHLIATNVEVLANVRIHKKVEVDNLSSLFDNVVFLKKVHLENVEVTFGDTVFQPKSKFTRCNFLHGAGIPAESVFTNSIYDGLLSQEMLDVREMGSYPTKGTMQYKTVVDDSVVQNAILVSPVVNKSKLINTALIDPEFTINNSDCFMDNCSIHKSQKDRIILSGVIFLGNSNTSSCDITIEPNSTIKDVYLMSLPKPDKNAVVEVNNMIIDGSNFPKAEGKYIFKNCDFEDFSLHIYELIKNHPHYEFDDCKFEGKSPSIDHLLPADELTNSSAP